MYAVVQIGSRILRSAWGTNLSVPPRFCAWTYGAATLAAATAAVPAMKRRRLRLMGDPPVRGPASASDGGTPPHRVQGRGGPSPWHPACSSTSAGGLCMQSEAGVFVRRDDAERAAAALESLGIPRDRITLLTPGADTRRVPTDEGERPGVGAALGTVTGAAMGFPLGAAVSLLVPGVGAVIASGLIGAVLLGAGGAAVGATLEESLVTGLPRDELFVYEDALRGGHTVVIALVEDEALAEAARRALAGAGAEAVDAARERWWLGLRSAEQEEYGDGPQAFERDEALYRRGFEAA